jgi:glycosyltransferase involved in cell wall biosynthesis
MNPRTSVIIAVYNCARALELVLNGYLRQSSRDFELFIADDGSGPEVRTLIEAYTQQAPFPVRYVSHPDEGYRKTIILNHAVRATEASFLIFADADCVPHSRFVEAHARHHGSRTVLCGRRVNLNQRISDSLTPQAILEGGLERFTAGRLLDALFSRGAHWDEGILITSHVLHRWINRKEPTLLGCNYSLEKSLLEEINGFNEDFVGYSGEDTELEYRLRLAGARFQWVRHLAIQYHLYHPSRTVNQGNLKALAQTQAAGNAACRNGLRKDLRPPTSDVRP